MTTSNNGEISYFKIGSFVLVGLGLMIFALLIFGSSKIFQPVVYVETYFEESIQGVSEGTPVKYRGLQIGYVEKIAFTSEIYKDSEKINEKMHARSIYVKIAITSKLFTQLTSDGFKQLLSKEIAGGLRVKLVTQGLTGTSYLELDYVNPKTSPPSMVSWSPNDFYVPSATSTLTRLSENAQYIMNELKDIDFKKLFEDLDISAASLGRVASKTEKLLNQINYPAITTMQNFKIISENLRAISSRVKLKPSDMIFSSYPPPLDPNKL